METTALALADPKFPPFPIVPLGTTIIPFIDFKEHGILSTRDSDTGQELDGIGIPTVALPILDKSDTVDSDAAWHQHLEGQSRHLRSFPSQHGKQWWQHWEESDKMRPPLFLNPKLPQLDRIYMATSIFRNGRRWPPERFNTTGPRYFWDQFRIFMGTQGYPPTWNRTDRSNLKEVPPFSPEDSDNEGSPHAKENTGCNISVAVNRNDQISKKMQDIPARPPYAYYDAKPVGLDSDEAVRALLELDKLRREERLVDFLSDPEGAIGVYLSSYMREQGFMWTDANLDIIPRLTCIFLKFLLKNRVFPEPAIDRRLQKALQVSEKGLKELPLTSIISKILPDEFGKACQEHWGSQKRAVDLQSSGEEPDADDDADTVELLGLETVNIPLADPHAHSEPTSLIFALKSDVFKSLLTPDTPFPTTHTLRFVERSLRRIVHISPPSTFSVHTRLQPGPRVESELEQMLAKITLEPWAGSGLFGYDQPEMVRKIGLASDSTKRGWPEDEHDPLKDEITILVSVASRNLGVLRNAIGMGLAGFWVQLTPVVEDDWDSRKVKYWYTDRLDAVLPSYWMA